MPLYGRQIDVLLGGQSISNFIKDLRVNFDVVKTDTNISNQAVISIYNLSPSNRAKIQELNTKIALLAGYEKDQGVKMVFIGDILRINHLYQYPDVITKIEAADGISELRDARAAKSFEEKVDARTVLEWASGELNIPIQDIPGQISGEYKQGFSHTGSIKTALDTICKRFNLDWSIQNGKLQVVKKGTVSKAAAINVSNATGLLEKIEKVGDIQEFFARNIAAESPIYKFKCLLNADIIPGCAINISQSNFAGGSFKVRQVQHLGDNFEGDFISVCQVQQATAGGS